MSRPNNFMLKNLAKNLAPKKIDSRKFRLKKALSLNAEQALAFAHAMNVTKKETGLLPSFGDFIFQMLKYGFTPPATEEEVREAEAVVAEIMRQEGGVLTEVVTQ